ncbi:zf-CCHC domain-containing protein [Tanacetum coccineum]
MTPKEFNTMQDLIMENKEFPDRLNIQLQGMHDLNTSVESLLSAIKWANDDRDEIRASSRRTGMRALLAGSLAMDISLWYIIVHGNYKPTIKDKDDDESIDCTFSRFNTIITSLKALDESFSSRNHVRKFLRALLTKWRPKVTAIEESKDLSKLSLDELIGNLKVYEVVLEKDLEVSKNKKEKYKSLALKARQVLSEEDVSSLDSNDEEYAMEAKGDKKEKEDRRCFKCGDPNHFISDCPKHSFSDQKAFVVGCWSDSGDDSNKEEICLMAQSNEVQSATPYYSSSSLDNESRQDEYDKLCKISLRIINKNKHVKAKNESLKRDVYELKSKVEQLEGNKEISHKCESCGKLVIEINSLKLKLASFENSSSSLRKMVEMQKSSKDNYGLGYTEDIASTRNNKIKSLGPQNDEMLFVESAMPVPSAREPACSDEQNRLSAAKTENAEKAKILGSNIVKKNDSVRLKVNLEPDEWIKDSDCTKHMTGNKDLFSSYKAIDGDPIVYWCDLDCVSIRGELVDIVKSRVEYSGSGVGTKRTLPSKKTKRRQSKKLVQNDEDKLCIEWTPEEDISLCQAWVCVSEDRVDGNEIKNDRFYLEILAHMHKNCLIIKRLTYDMVNEK